MRAFLILFMSLFFSLPAVSEVQYTPSPSLEKHGLFIGGIFDNNFLKSIKSTKDIKLPQSWLLSYDLYFPEINETLLEDSPYKNFFKVGLSFGAHAYDKGHSSAFKFCDSKRFLGYNVGAKASFDYLEYFRPFVEAGLSRSNCVQYNNLQDFNFSDSTKNTKAYYSIGALLSFKVFHRASMYGLDQDYGINDVGFFAKCSWFSFQEKDEDALKTCTLGINFVF